MKQLILITAAMCIAQLLPAQDLADLFEDNKHSVVTIYVAEQLNAGTGDPRTFTSNMGLGSGVLISQDRILTAAHVVANAEEIMVQFFDGESISAETYRISRIADVAVIRLEKAPSHAKVAVIGNSDETRIGDEVFVVGAPMGLPYSLSRGVISGRHSEDKLTSDGKMLEFFQTDAAINTGNSGGPMFNYKGEVIGIVSSILTGQAGLRESDLQPPPRWPMPCFQPGAVNISGPKPWCFPSNWPRSSMFRRNPDCWSSTWLKTVRQAPSD